MTNGTQPIITAINVKQLLTNTQPQLLKKGKQMNKELLIEALEIGASNMQYDGEYSKYDEVMAYVKELELNK
jgi:hypothetical protein